MTIAEFVASPLAGDCTLLKRLYEFDRTARKKNLHLGITLLDIGPYGGTILYDPTKTPTNSLTFATTGGDDVHFSLVAMNGNFGDSSPVVITIPMAGKTPRETNFIVGETLRDFLQLGCVRGFFDLEELAYPWKTKMFDRYSQPPANTDDPVYEQFRTEFSLTPWSNIEPRLQVLDTKYWSTLRFHRD